MFRLPPVGGFFRLLSRRLLNALQFFPGPLDFVGGDFFRAAGAGAAAARTTGPAAKLYTGVYMFRAKADDCHCGHCPAPPVCWSLPSLPRDFSGASAFEFTQAAVGVRAAALGLGGESPAAGVTFARSSRTCECEVIEDAFTAKTPKGDVPMKNIIAKFPGKSGQARLPSPATSIPSCFRAQIRGRERRRIVHRTAAGTGARAGPDRTATTSTWCFSTAKKPWASGRETDSVYGSRHLAEKWKADGTLRAFKALINVDMIGDKSWTSDRRELDRIAAQAGVEGGDRSGLQSVFSRQPREVDDDHMPFLKLGVPSLDLIDFDYDLGTRTRTRWTS